MELLIELIEIIGAKLVETSAKRTKTRAYEKAFKKNLQRIKHILLIVMLATSILLPAYFFYDGYQSGNLSQQYFYVGATLVILTLFSNFFTFMKMLELFQQEIKTSITYESSTIEDDLRYEMGLLVLLAFLSAIPILNLIVNPLSIDRAVSILEDTSNNHQRRKIRALAGQIALSSLIIFLASSLVFSLVLIILGDTRNL